MEAGSPLLTHPLKRNNVTVLLVLKTTFLPTRLQAFLSTREDADADEASADAGSAGGAVGGAVGGAAGGAGGEAVRQPAGAAELAEAQRAAAAAVRSALLEPLSRMKGAFGRAAGVTRAVRTRGRHLALSLSAEGVVCLPSVPSHDMCHLAAFSAALLQDGTSSGVMPEAPTAVYRVGVPHLLFHVLAKSNSGRQCVIDAAALHCANGARCEIATQSCGTSVLPQTTPILALPPAPSLPSGPPGTHRAGQETSHRSADGGGEEDEGGRRRRRGRQGVVGRGGAGGLVIGSFFFGTGRPSSTAGAARRCSCWRRRQQQRRPPARRVRRRPSSNCCCVVTGGLDRY